MADTKKRLLIFVPTFPVISETFIQREIVKLVQVARDYEVTVLSLTKGQADIDSILQSRVHFKRITLSDMIRGFMSVSFLRLFKVAKIALSNKNRGVFGNLYLLLKSVGYASLIDRYAPDHIHAHFLSESSTLMYFVSELRDIRFSISAHARDVFGSSMDATLNPELVRDKASKADFIVVCNKKAWLKCKELAGHEFEQKILLHYHGLDPAILPEKNLKDDPQAPTILVSVGRLVEKKGFIYLIQASKILKERGIPHQINIVGPGPLYEFLQSKISEFQVGDTVNILGGGKGMPNTAVLKLMAQSDIFILPSIETGEGDAEGVPNTLVEAAFMGIPIITTKTGSIQELFTDGQNALLVPSKDPEKLAEATTKIRSNPGLFRNMTENAKKSVSATFDMNINIVTLDGLFCQNLGTK